MTQDAYVRLNALGDSLREKLAAMLRHRGIAAQVFGRGSLFAVRLTHHELREWWAVCVSRHVASEPIYGLLSHEMLGRGILMSQRGILGTLSTPTGSAEVDAFVEALDDALRALGRTVVSVAAELKGRISLTEAVFALVGYIIGGSIFILPGRPGRTSGAGRIPCLPARRSRRAVHLRRFGPDRQRVPRSAGAPTWR